MTVVLTGRSGSLCRPGSKDVMITLMLISQIHPFVLLKIVWNSRRSRIAVCICRNSRLMFNNYQEHYSSIGGLCQRFGCHGWSPS